MGGVLFSGSAAATMPEASAKRPFDHPADEAAAVFKPFIAQSRVQLFYVAEVIAVQGKPADIGDYYQPDHAKASAALRPSKTLNEILASV